MYETRKYHCKKKRQTKAICLANGRAIHYQIRATNDVGKFQWFKRKIFYGTVKVRKVKLNIFGSTLNGIYQLLNWLRNTQWTWDIPSAKNIYKERPQRLSVCTTQITNYSMKDDRQFFQKRKSFSSVGYEIFRNEKHQIATAAIS